MNVRYHFGDASADGRMTFEINGLCGFGSASSLHGNAISVPITLRKWLK